MNEAIEVLKERGFFNQCTDIDELSSRMDSGPISFYVGCDPTGASLHIGHMVPFFAFRHLVNAGHRGIALIGGGTGCIGDPSGKTEMRKMLEYSQIDDNVSKITKQLDRFLHFDGVYAQSANNKDWLADLRYIDFLRDIGSCFSVNKMLTYEEYKIRLEKGLSFLEFNYQLLQAFDFYMLHQKFGTILQIGGADQWGNITAGVDLIRRKLGGTTELNKEHQVFGLTFPLIMRADGKKMGKSEKGAIFLDPSLTTEFDFFQYWRNVPDADVKKFFLLFTFLLVDEIEKICMGDINSAKERLAYEVTKIIHGQEKANEVLSGTKSAFSDGGDKNYIPTVELEKPNFDIGINVCDLYFNTKLCASKSEARRLIQQGGASINGQVINDIKTIITTTQADNDGEFIVKAGKKRIIRIITK